LFEVLLLEIPFGTAPTRVEEFLSPNGLHLDAEIRRVKIVAESNPVQTST
jgi:hypothetical protein